MLMGKIRYRLGGPSRHVGSLWVGLEGYQFFCVPVWPLVKQVASTGVVGQDTVMKGE